MIKKTTKIINFCRFRNHKKIFKNGVFGLAPETLAYLIVFGILALIIIAVMGAIFKK